MSAETKRTILTIRAELRRLTEFSSLMWNPRVVALMNQIKQENREKATALEAELAALRGERKPSTRWPANTPADVVKLCEAYWAGSTELHTFRIHLWNDKAVWTSYPAGGYSTNGGWNPTPSQYFLISRADVGFRKRKPLELATLGFERHSRKRVTPAMMQAKLDEL